MPLKLTRREGTSLWHVAGTVAGQRIRESTGTADRSLAEEYRAKREAEIFHGSIYGKKAVAKWSQAVAGYTADTPMNRYSADQLLRITDCLGASKKLKDIDQSTIGTLIRALCKPGTKPATIRRHIITPVRAVMGHAALNGLCDVPVFKTPRDPGGKIDKARTRWLRPEEFRRLHAAASPHLKPLLMFYVCTGARLSEALRLEWEDVDLRARRLTLRDTKNGSDRLVDDLPPALIEVLEGVTYPERGFDAEGKRTVTQRRHRTGRVFRTRFGEDYGGTETETAGQIKTAWAGAVRRAGFPGEWKEGAKGQRWWKPLDVTPHVLRHTWASWYLAIYMVESKLMAAGDWSDLRLVSRYAKICPDYEKPAILEVWGMPADMILPQHPRLLSASL